GRLLVLAGAAPAGPVQRGGEHALRPDLQHDLGGRALPARHCCLLTIRGGPLDIDSKLLFTVKCLCRTHCASTGAPLTVPSVSGAPTSYAGSGHVGLPRNGGPNNGGPGQDKPGGGTPH